MLFLKLVKAALTLLHGCSDAERGFPLTRILVSSDRASMSERVLNAKLCVIGELNTYGGKPERFSIPKELLTFARLVWSKYQDHLESKVKEQAPERSVQDKEMELNLVDISSNKKNYLRRAMASEDSADIISGNSLPDNVI